jgi:hypothetical protein
MITNGYATLAQFKAHISMRGLAGSVGTDTSDDAVIELMIESASRYIDRETGERFYPDTNDTVYYYQAENSRSVRLPSFASITTVAVDFNNSRTYTELVVSTDYDLVPDNYTAEGIPINGLELSPLSSYYFPTQRKGIKVTGKRGWSAAPTDIKDACLEIVQNIYSSRSGQSTAGRINVTASGIVIRPDDVPDYAQRIIQHYRDLT